MFKRLFREIIAIKEELQAIRRSMEPIRFKNQIIGVVTEVQEKYANQAEGLTTVFFQIPSHDWNLLKRSDAWILVNKYLAEIQNTYILKSQKEHRD